MLVTQAQQGKSEGEKKNTLGPPCLLPNTHPQGIAISLGLPIHNVTQPYIALPETELFTPTLALACGTQAKTKAGNGMPLANA